jgi:hypothetical protein
MTKAFYIHYVPVCNSVGLYSQIYFFVDKIANVVWYTCFNFDANLFIIKADKDITVSLHHAGQ